jgi:hypothetical protein
VFCGACGDFGVLRCREIYGRFVLDPETDEFAVPGPNLGANSAAFRLI